MVAHAKRRAEEEEKGKGMGYGCCQVGIKKERIIKKKKVERDGDGESERKGVEWMGNGRRARTDMVPVTC